MLDRFYNRKLLAHTDKLRQIAAGEHPYPVDWHIFPSNKCNHKCTWCMYRQNGEQFDFPVLLPRETLLRAVGDAARTGATLIHFSGGGEPLINKHTIEAMRLAQALASERPARELPLKIALSTNGRLLTPEVAGLVDYIRVSLNAGTAKQHTATNHAGDGPGDWDEIIQRIEACAPLARQDIGLGYVVDYENYGDIYEFCKIASRILGQTSPSRQRFVHIRPGFYYESAKDEATKAIMPEAFEASERAKRDFGHLIDIYAIAEKFDGYWTPRKFSKCRAVLTGTCLRATGDFAVCQDRTDLSFGAKYKRGTPFEDIWGSPEHLTMLARLHDGAGGELPICPRCVWGGRNTLIDSIEADTLRIALV